MPAGQSLPEYHGYAHRIAGWLGFNYDASDPGWVHPVMHLILVLAPAILAVTLSVLLARTAHGFLKARLGQPSPGPLARVDGLHPSLVQQVWHATRARQLGLVVLSLSSMPLLYLSLELPKQIVNNVLDGYAAPVSFLGVELQQVKVLALLSSAYFITILLHGINKYCLNVFRGRVAEHFLRQLRLLIYRSWRRRAEPGGQAEIVQVLGQEAEPLGGFAAELLTLPLTQGGTMATILVFMFIQDPILGAAALAVLPVQLALLPGLQRMINQRSRARIAEMRNLARLLAGELRPQPGPASAVRAATASLRRLELLRLDIHRIKFFTKSLNNFLTSLTPFLFYSLGGYFVIEERISLGALVAVLAAHKDFSAPLKELFRFYQQIEDTRLRYGGILHFLRPEPGPAWHRGG
ncbi:ABC transporter ATP-binding protein [Cribrihabitans neustonicus]|uniref:ABC transporter ATP-binding protein n=1 Tax=Cribrihabitans neustonicus TaxID=1429085 RepID=UPI003B5CBBFF